MKNCRFDTNKVLLVELQSYEDQGISLWLEGEAVTGVMTVKEANQYMRDYVIDDGVVSEIRFDRVTRE